MTELLYRLSQMQKHRENEAETILRKRGIANERVQTKEEFIKDELHRVSWEFLKTE